MSRILKNKYFTHKKLLVGMSALLLMLLSVILIMLGNIFLALLCVLMLLAVSLNIFVLKKMQNSVKVFSPNSRIRNVDYLIIGDMCELHTLIAEKGNMEAQKVTYVQLSAPGRTLLSSYEILRHAYGILKESESKVILIVKRKNIERQRYSVFDIPIFMLSPLSVKRLGLEKLRIKSYFPLILSPLKSIRLLCSKESNNVATVDDIKPFLVGSYQKIRCPDDNINMFCAERGINLEVWSK